MSQLDREMKRIDREERVKIGCTVLMLVAYVVFYGALIYAVVHFARKFW